MEGTTPNLAYAVAISSRDMIAPAETDPEVLGEEAARLIADLLATVRRVTDATPRITAGPSTPAKSVGPKAS